MRPGVRLNLPEAFRQARVQLRKMGLPSGIHDTVSVLLDISMHHGKGYGCFPKRRTVRKWLVQNYGHTSRTRGPELPAHERLAATTADGWMRAAEDSGLIVRQMRGHRRREKWNRSNLYTWGPVLWSLGPVARKLAAARARAELWGSIARHHAEGLLHVARSAFEEAFPRLQFEDFYSPT